MERIENGDITGDLADIIKRTIEAFDKARDQKKHKNFAKYGNNYYTIAYAHEILTNRAHRDSHTLSIGCPMNIDGAPRFTMEMTKAPSIKTPKALERSGEATVWLHKKREGNIIMLEPLPHLFYPIALNFFRHVLDSYPGNAKTAENKAQFIVGGSMGPEGVLG